MSVPPTTVRTLITLTNTPIGSPGSSVALFAEALSPMLSVTTGGDRLIVVTVIRVVDIALTEELGCLS